MTKRCQNNKMSKVKFIGNIELNVRGKNNLQHVNNEKLQYAQRDESEMSK